MSLPGDRAEACETCVYFETDSPDGVFVDRGRCLRNPPMANADGEGIWPSVASEDWCGEYRESELAVSLIDQAAQINELGLAFQLSPGVHPGVHPSGTLPSAPETSAEKGTKDA